MDLFLFLVFAYGMNYGVCIQFDNVVSGFFTIAEVRSDPHDSIAMIFFLVDVQIQFLCLSIYYM